MRKGVELPMNTLVVVAIAIIILLAMVAFFMSGFGPQSTQQTRYAALMAECQKWTAVGCEGNLPDELKNKYKEWKGKSGDEPEIRQVCGCPGAYTTKTTQSSSE